MQTGLPDPIDDLKDEIAALREEVWMLRELVKAHERLRFGADWERRERGL